jgi:uncharacterized protein YoxC
MIIGMSKKLEPQNRKEIAAKRKKLEEAIEEKKNRINKQLQELRIMVQSLDELKGDEGSFIQNSIDIGRRFF